MQDLPFIECKGTFRELGRQYGEQARQAIANNVDLWMGSRFKLTDTFVGNAMKVLQRFVPDVLEELEGLAEGANQPMTAMLLMNHVNAFQQGVPPTGCTAMALTVAGGGEGSPVIAKNNDIVPDPRIHAIRKCTPDRGLPIIHVANAGWLSGLDSLNAAGLGSAHCSVGSSFDRSGQRLDIRLWMYHLARTCRTTEEYLENLEAVPLTGKGFNVVLLDARGDGCVLEAAVPLVGRRDRGKPFVYATNHFVTDALAEADGQRPPQRNVSVYRYGYLNWVEQTRPPRSADDIAALLKSHEPWSPCRHGGPHGSSTVWSMIGLPARRRLSVAAGAPCTSPYRDFEL